MENRKYRKTDGKGCFFIAHDEHTQHSVGYDENWKCTFYATIPQTGGLGLWDYPDENSVPEWITTLAKQAELT